MRRPALTVARLSAVMVCLFLAPAAHAVTIEWSIVGAPGNACDVARWDCPGAVPYEYRIAKHEVTNLQYAELLNAKAASDPLALYNTEMASAIGGILRSGSPGSYSYTPIAGREAMPVVFVSFYDAIRFANWMHNGQGNGDTETGAYTLLGGTPTPGNEPISRNGGAAFFVPDDDEWYKAAYYNPGSASYVEYPTGTSVVCSSPGPALRTANCGGVNGGFTPVGSYTGSASPHGTFDQGGNAFEWVDQAVILENRAIRGGYFGSTPDWLSRLRSEYDDPWFESSVYGFRLAGPVPAAAEVTNLRASDPMATHFEWDPMPGRSGAVYDLVRGDVSSLSGSASGIALGPLTCIEEDSPDASSLSAPDAEVPPAGTAFFYLVRFQQGLLVGPWGFGSDGREQAGGGCGP